MEVKTFILEYTKNLDKISCHSYDPEYLRLMSELNINGISLNNLSQKITYGAGKWELRTSDYVPENYPNAIKLLQISNINNFGKIINTNRDKFIPVELHNKWKISQVKKGDLLIAITGTLGRLALFNEDYEANLNQALGIIRLKKEHNGIKIIPEFIHFYLNSYFALEQFMALGGYRSGQSGLSLNEIGTIQIILPEEDKQKTILKRLEEIKSKIIDEQNKYYSYLDKIGKLLDDYTGLDLSNISQTWITEPEKIQPLPDISEEKPYTIQIRAFKTRRAAEALTKKFIGEGFDAHWKKVVLGSGNVWYRTFIGHFSSREDAQAFKESLSADGSLKECFIRKLSSD